MIDIGKAEDKILGLMPELTLLGGEINTHGKYLVFDSIGVNELTISDIDYKFNIFVAIKTFTGKKKGIYQPLDTVLASLYAHAQTDTNLVVGNVKPYAAHKLIIYQVPLTVKGFTNQCNTGECDD